MFFEKVLATIVQIVHSYKFPTRDTSLLGLLTFFINSAGRAVEVLKRRDPWRSPDAISDGSPCKIR